MTCRSSSHRCRRTCRLPFSTGQTVQPVCDNGDRLDASPSAETSVIKKTHYFVKTNSHCSPRCLLIRKQGFCAVDDCERQQIKPTAVPRFALSDHMFPAVSVQGAALAAVAWPCVGSPYKTAVRSLPINRAMRRLLTAVLEALVSGRVRLHQ